MMILVIIVVAAVLLLAYMWKQANENNVQQHVIKAIGTNETVYLFFISDTHARKINEKMIATIDKKVDAVIIGGDFVDRRTSEQTLLENIRLLQKLGPIYFVWGNNDVEFGEKKLRKWFAQHNVRIIENEATTIPSDNKLKLGATAYYLSDEKMKKIVRQCEGSTTVFIAHNPQLFPKVYRYIKPLLSMGGHLHGGQIRLGKFGIQPHGYFKQHNDRYELVSNGYGTTLLPLRLCAKPECHLIEINFQQIETTKTK